MSCGYAISQQMPGRIGRHASRAQALSRGISGGGRGRQGSRVLHGVSGGRRRGQGLTPSGILAAAGVFEEEKERAGLARRSKDHKRRRRTRPFLAFYFFYYFSQSRHA